MPPHLNLTTTSTHGNMILSSRNSPRLSLRHAGSYNSSDRGPLSSTSSRFSFHHLIASPPPSPSLPALIPRHGKPVALHKPQSLVRAIFWLLGVLLILYFGITQLQPGYSVHSVGWATDAGDQYEMVGGSELPDFPTPVVVMDKRGRAKWTISIPPNLQFPLQPSQYAEICKQNMEVANHVVDLHKHGHEGHSHYDYYRVDPNFMDVAEAEALGLLPGAKGRTSMSTGQDGNIIGENTDELVESEVCDKSMTFLMETADAGLGKTLMMLWTAYGLAEKEGRAFFVDDSRWAYGRYTNFFQAPPSPNCRPPPRHEMLPCPHHARHLVVSAATVSQTFGGAFNEEFEDPKKMEVYRQKPLFAFARQGYEALFQLASEDADSVDKRVLELQSKAMVDPPRATGAGMVIGIHVRHGDRRPYEFQYRDSYVPLDRYTDKANELLDQKFNASGRLRGSDVMTETHSLIVVASDDPVVYESEEFSHSYRAQEQIRLAIRQTDDSSPKPSERSMRRFVEEAVGWEGGFFAGMFWSLGKPSTMPATAVEVPNTKLPPTAETIRLRELVGRAYLMDLAVLGRTSDVVICTVSSMGCKLLAVMLGWERAIEKHRFVNIDGNFDWRGVYW